MLSIITKLVFAGLISLVFSIDPDTDSLIKGNVRGGKCNSNYDCGPKEACGWLFGKCYRVSCYRDSDCFPHEYCLTRSKSRFGDCYLKGADGDLCLMDSR